MFVIISFVASLVLYNSKGKRNEEENFQSTALEGHERKAASLSLSISTKRSAIHVYHSRIKFIKTHYSLDLSLCRQGKENK
jgi:PBP1b-binding outer membrane lipoprotein LpoB